MQDRICYGTFGELARRHVNMNGDVRAFTQSLFERAPLTTVVLLSMQQCQHGQSSCSRSRSC
eukprot:697225-Amphidinium_carterae.1